MRKVDKIKAKDGFRRCYLNVGFSKQIKDIAYAKSVFESNGFNVLAPIDTEISTERSSAFFLIL